MDICYKVYPERLNGSQLNGTDVEHLIGLIGYLPSVFPRGRLRQKLVFNDKFN